MLLYTVVTHYPSGHDVSVLQRIMLTWCVRSGRDEKGNKIRTKHILVCHIANLHSKSEDDTIYAKSFEPVYHNSNTMPHKGDFMHFHSADGSEYYLHSDTISYIEAHSAKKQCIIHTKTGDITVPTRLSDIEKLRQGSFLRCHQSFLVNPNYIRSVRRFAVILANGSEIPVPEKKYTAFRAKLNTLIEESKRKK